jgi:hypothetical protein
MTDPERTTLGALVIAGIVLGIRAAQAGDLRPGIYVPFGIAALIILGIETFAPSLGAAFAVLLLVVLLLGDAEQVARQGTALYNYVAGPKHGHKP